MNIAKKTNSVRNKNEEVNKEKASKIEKNEKNFSPYYKKEKIQYKSVFCIIELLLQQKYL